MNYWLLLEKSDDTRISKGIDGYQDSTGEAYHYDSFVPNHRNVAVGDSVILRKENEIIGVGTIADISETLDAKIHRRCPKCDSTDIRERLTMKPKWKCGKCSEEFSEPNETVAEVRSFVASIEEFSRLNVPVSVQAVKLCAVSGDGVSSQLSMIRLDPIKVQTLFEGIDIAPALKDPVSTTRGQGFGLSQAERRAVELQAMKIARALYEDNGWSVIDKSSSQPFDLLATKGTDFRFIEVKGTTGEGLSVILTHGEVGHIRRNEENSALVLVARICLEHDGGQWIAKGGTVTTHEDPWLLLENNLSPTQYRYEIN